MKEFLKRVTERVANFIRDLDFDEAQKARDTAIRNYRSGLAGMAGVVDPDPFVTAPSMRLVAGSVNIVAVEPDMYRVLIHDKNDGDRFHPPIAPFAAYGSSVALAQARADQLIGALDGGRRL